jgi:cytochrome c oxidase assembly protein subunit 15
VAATFVLILAGGLVTNTGSALAVPDWPTTFGHNMFLYPWSQMVGGVFYEHSHRLLGFLVGMLTVTVAVALWWTERRGWVRAVGGIAVGLVVVQGVLGGLRVVLLEGAIAIVHGCVAHAFFAVVVVLAVVTSRQWDEIPAMPGAGPLRALAAGAVGLLYLQIVLGALLTHAGRLSLHLAGAAAVFVFVPMVTARARATGQHLVTGPAGLLAVLLTVQLALGAGAYLTGFSSVAIPGGRVLALALPVLHRLGAALILGTAVTLLAVLIKAARAPASSADAVALEPGWPPMVAETRS